MTPTHTIRMTTRDGDRVVFPCASKETVVAAAARAGLTIPGSCREGGCGCCRATVTAGDATLDSHSPAALTEEAAARGEVLLCRTRPQSDLDIAAPFDRAQLSAAVAQRQAAVEEVMAIGDRTRRLVLTLMADAEGGCAAEFEPGQYMELILPDGVTRAYSLANTPNWLGRLEFLIRLQPGGAFSHWLETKARPGERLAVRGPHGGFTLRADSPRPRWFVAGGTGLAPMLSMLRRMAEFGEDQPARLFFGVNEDHELFALDDLEQLAAGLPRLKVTLCVMRPGPAWRGFVGTAVDALKAGLDDGGARPDVYLCGPPGMVDAAEALCRAQGLPAEAVMSERFLPG